jgi:hypothetical protein
MCRCADIIVNSNATLSHFNILMLSSGNVRASSAQGRKSNGSAAAGQRSLQEMQTELLLRTYRGRTESFTGLDSKQKSNASYNSSSHFLRQTFGFEREKTSDLPTSKSHLIDNIHVCCKPTGDNLEPCLRDCC